MPGHALLNFAPLLVLLAWAAAIDARSRRIPNWITLGLLVSGLARAIVFHNAISPGQALLGMLVGLSVPVILYCISAMGAGDVKLLAAIGAWLGPGPVFVVLIVETLAGLVIVVVQSILQRNTTALVRNSALVAINLASAGETGLESAIERGKAVGSISRPLPYAVPVLIATIVVLWVGSFSGGWT